LFRTALALLGSRPAAEDAVQEVFVGLAHAGGKLVEVNNLPAYLLSSVRRASAPRPFLHFVSGHFPPATLTQPHSHPCIALHGCLQGPVTLITPQGEVVLEAGIFYVIGPGQRHYWRNSGRHTAATLSLLLDTTNPGRWPAAAAVDACCRALEAKVRGFHRFSTASDDELRHSFWLAADHLTAEQPRDPSTLAGVMLALLGQVKERLCGTPTTPGVDADAAQGIRRLLVARVRDRLSLRQIAREVDMSPTRAKETFRQAFGCGIMTYFNQLKIWQAKRLLNDPALTVEQVSHQLGFSSPSYFTRAFLKNAGETPSAYRQSLESDA
jgi:AraC-like DNA-binding protein/mannose-6-phosphate isomerase-like protein (cupin superfamily)